MFLQYLESAAGGKKVAVFFHAKLEFFPLSSPPVVFALFPTRLMLSRNVTGVEGEVALSFQSKLRYGFPLVCGGIPLRAGIVDRIILGHLGHHGNLIEIAKSD